MATLDEMKTRLEELKAIADSGVAESAIDNRRTRFHGMGDLQTRIDRLEAEIKAKESSALRRRTTVVSFGRFG